MGQLLTDIRKTPLNPNPDASQLAPNESWQVIDAMMGERTLDVLTSTAQMQVVGKRHYGRKALEPGEQHGFDVSV